MASKVTMQTAHFVPVQADVEETRWSLAYVHLMRHDVTFITILVSSTVLEPAVFGMQPL
jgi:hypothetical protein